jgi:apoptotic chromatin condensation inducer in the nucleus
MAFVKERVELNFNNHQQRFNSLKKIEKTGKFQGNITDNLSKEEPEYVFDIINGEDTYPKLSKETLNYLLDNDDDDHGRGQVNDERGPVDNVRGPVDNVRGPVDNVRDPVDNVRGPVDNVRGPVDNVRGREVNERRRGFDESQIVDERRRGFDESQGNYRKQDDDEISEDYNKSDLYSGTPLSKKKGFFQGKIHKIYKIGKNLRKSDTEILNSYVAKLLVLKYIIIKYECLFKLAEAIYPILGSLNPNNVILTIFFNEMIKRKDNNTNKDYIYIDDENKTFNVELNIFTNYIEYIINNRKKSKEKLNEIKKSIQIFNDKEIKIYNIKGIINKQILFISSKLYYYITDYIINLYESREPNLKKFKKKINKYIKFNNSNYSKFSFEIKKNREMNIMKKSNNNFDVDVDEKSSINIIKKFINKDIEKFLQFINDIINCMKVISLSLYGINQKMTIPHKNIPLDMKMYFDSTQFYINTLISDYIKNKDKYLNQIK